MATVTKGRTFTSGETVTPAKLNDVVDLATVTNIQTADIADGQITTAKILDANVTTAKIADANVTAPKLQNGVTLQTVYAQTTSIQVIDQIIPADNTKPQSTEGEEIITASITPSSSTNKILIEAMIQGAGPVTAGGTIALALFKNNDTSAIATSYSTHAAGFGNQIWIVHQDSPATTSTTTYKLRAGYPGAGSSGLYMNGGAAGESVYDGTVASWMKLTEIKAS
jgi:hypothetical protein